MGGDEEITAGPGWRQDPGPVAAPPGRSLVGVGRLARLRRTARPPRLPAGWARTHPVLVTGAAAVALMVAAAGTWTWQRTHPPPPQSQLRVQLDTSGNARPVSVDARGTAQLLLPLRVTVGDQLGGPVRLLALTGGGLTSAEAHLLTEPGVARFTVRATVSCNQWADGRGVQARFALAGGGPPPSVQVPLDLGQPSPLQAQVTRPCVQFAAQHPLWLAGFTVAVDPKQPLAHTTWTLVNRSGAPVLLPGSTDVQIMGAGLPLRVLADAGPTTVAPHGTAFVVRTFEITSCLDPAALQLTYLDVRLTGSSAATAQLPTGLATVDLPADLAGRVLAVARTACAGAPALQQPRAVVLLQPPPAGSVSPDLGGSPGQVVVQVTSPVGPAAPGPFVIPGSSGPFAATLEPDWYVGPVASRPFAALTQSVPVPGQLSLSGTWTLTGCDQAPDSTLRAPALTVLLSGLRVYPYLLPVSPLGRTACAPANNGS